MLRVILSLALVTSLAACGASRLNPLNWFGGDRETRVETVEAAEPADLRGLVAEVTALSVEATSQGAIIRATGLPPTQGFWEAELVEVARGEGSITYEFRVFPPVTPARVSTAQSREVITGTQLSNRELAEIRRVTVIAAQNSRTVSRR
ncbi:hypothetical protein [Roseicyclus amphidinii]|uniref:hypothetical protein n=1 Tax=Roseicyclus amphidinii TaxID=3034232 RepID=UPI0024E0C1C2|nr:hypothetical protein [Roseicyclus sp. Amp-Y-6]